MLRIIQLTYKFISHTKSVLKGFCRNDYAIDERQKRHFKVNRRRLVQLSNDHFEAVSFIFEILEKLKVCKACGLRITETNLP